MTNLDYWTNLIICLGIELWERDLITSAIDTLQLYIAVLLFSTASINDTGIIFIAPQEYYHNYYNLEILYREIHYPTDST